MKNAVFIHNPKTAGSYIIKALGLQDLSFPHRLKHFEQNGRVTFGHQDYQKLVDGMVVSEEFNKSAWKFCFCRNPYDRAVSHYFYVRKSLPDILPNNVSFLDYTRSLGKIKTPRRFYGRVAGEYFFCPQVENIKKVDLDFIGRFENLKSDLMQIADVLKIKLKKYRKIRASKHLPYSTYYNQETIENVRNYYKEDFEYFGYDDNILHREQA